MHLFLGSNTLQSYHANHSYTWLQSDNRGKSHLEFPSPGAERLMWDGLMSNQSTGLSIKSLRGLEKETSLPLSLVCRDSGHTRHHVTEHSLLRRQEAGTGTNCLRVIGTWCPCLRQGHLLSSHLLLRSTINLTEPPQLSVPPVLTLSIPYCLIGTLFSEKLRCWLKPPGAVIVDEAQLVRVSIHEAIPVEWVSGTGLVYFLFSCIFSLPDRDKMSPLCFSSSVVSFCCIEIQTLCVVWA